MRILIVEDEQSSAERIKRLVLEIDSHHEIVEILKSNAEVRAFFTASVAVDLILADIQLGDGLSFESLKSVPNDILLYLRRHLINMPCRHLNLTVLIICSSRLISRNYRQY